MTSHHSDFARATDPGSRSPAELEREVRESRADVERTLDAIQDRLSPGQLVDQVAHYLRDNGGEFARNFGDTVRQNPVPVVLVGVGLAWMMFSGPRHDGGLPRAADFVPDYPPIRTIRRIPSPGRRTSAARRPSGMATMRTTSRAFRAMAPPRPANMARPRPAPVSASAPGTRPRARARA